MNNQNRNQNETTDEFILILLLDFFVLITSLVAFNYIWVKPIGITLLAQNEGDDQHQGLVRITFTDLFSVIKYHSKLIWKFDPLFWIKVCGFEGYQYLFFQRQLLYLMLFYMVTMIFSFFFVPKISLFFLDENFSFKYQFTMTALNSIYLLLCLYYMLVALDIRQIDQKKGSWIQQHTLHMKGVPLNVTQTQLEENIRQFLTKNELGNLIAINLVPNNAKMLQLQAQKRHYDMLLSLEKLPHLMNCIIPSKYRRKEYLEYKRNAIQEQQIKLMERNQKNSGHAFFCVDSDQAVVRLIDMYSSNRANLSCLREYCCNQIGSPFCGHWEDQDQIVVDGTLPVVDNDQIIRNDQQFPTKSTILIKQAPPPLDILYQNFHLGLKSQICRKIIFNLLAMLLLIFCTTPMAIIQILGLKFISGLFDGFELEFVTLMLVVAVNSLLLLLIDLAAEWERHASKSLFQKSIYTRCVFYLTMNMLFIPSLSFLAVTNLYQLLIDDANNLFTIIQAIYFLSNGQFFTTLIIQSACFSVANYLLRFSELFLAWFDVRFAEYKRRYFQSQQLLPPDKLFQYGYFYGLQICILYIIMTFSTNVPIIHLAGAFFYFVRHLMDSFLLHWVYHEDMDSQGEMFHRAVISAGFSILPLQIVMLTIFLIQEELMYVLLTMVLIGVTIIAIIYLSTKNKMSKDSKSYLQMLFSIARSHDIAQWEQEYRHPLIVYD